jgi:hypothetical protein
LVALDGRLAFRLRHVDDALRRLALAFAGAGLCRSAGAVRRDGADPPIIEAVLAALDIAENLASAPPV